MQVTAIRALRDRWRRCSLISVGPVAQFRPIASMPSGSSAVSAAPISRAEEHGAGGLDGDLDHDRAATRPPRPARAWQPTTAALACRRSCEVSMRNASAPPVDQPAGLLGVGVPQRGDTGHGPGRAAWCPAPWSRARTGVGSSVDQCVGRLTGDARTGLRELVDALGDVVLPEVGQVRAEGVGLDGVDAHLEVGVVDRPDDVGPGDVEDLVAPLVPLEVVERGVSCLEHGAHGAVGHEHTVTENAAEEVGAAAHYCLPSRLLRGFPASLRQTAPTQVVGAFRRLGSAGRPTRRHG